MSNIKKSDDAPIFARNNTDLIASLQEVADDLSGKRPLPSASTLEELEKLLNK